MDCGNKIICLVLSVDIPCSACTPKRHTHKFRYYKLIVKKLLVVLELWTVKMEKERVNYHDDIFLFCT